MKNLLILTTITLLISCGKDNKTEQQPTEGVQVKQVNKVQMLHSLECIRDNYGMKCDGYTLSCDIAYYSNSMECKIKTNKEVK